MYVSTNPSNQTNKEFEMTKQSISRKRRICVIPDCESPVHGYDWCHKHYCRWRKYGNPLTVQTFSDTATRFWLKVDKTPGLGRDGECWLWTASTWGEYGSFEVAGKKYSTHRYAFFLANGHFPEPIGRHTCDVKLCVNPDHIIEGTQKDNIQDAVERGLLRDQQGENAPMVKLNNDKVREIRVLRQQGIATKILADLYDISVPTISEICNYRTWKHIA